MDRQVAAIGEHAPRREETPMKSYPGHANHVLLNGSLDRRDLLRLGGAGLIATVPAGFAGVRRATAQDSVSLELDFLTPESVMQPLVDAYTEQNPNVEFKTTYAMADQYQAAARTELTSGTAADVMCVWPGNGNAMALFVLAPGGFVADLSAEPWVDQMPAGLDAVTKVDGKTMILVPGFATIGTIYNKLVF